jgi:hypothetical protein
VSVSVSAEGEGMCGKRQVGAQALRWRFLHFALVASMMWEFMTALRSVCMHACSKLLAAMFGYTPVDCTSSDASNASCVHTIRYHHHNEC